MPVVANPGAPSSITRPESTVPDTAKSKVPSSASLVPKETTPPNEPVALVSNRTTKVAVAPCATVVALKPDANTKPAGSVARPASSSGASPTLRTTSVRDTASPNFTEPVPSAISVAPTHASTSGPCAGATGVSSTA